MIKACCFSVWLLAACGVATGCGETPDSGPALAPQAAPQPSVSKTPKASPPPKGKAAKRVQGAGASGPAKGVSAARAQAESARKPRREWRGEYCEGDSGCQWDDACAPKRCQGRAPGAQDRECGESLPPPGQCVCNAGFCVTKIAAAKVAPTGPACQKTAECALDVATGQCHGVSGQRLPLIRVSGALCRCDEATKTCRYQWMDPVACSSWRDCSWTRTPRLRPVSSKEVPRPTPRPVKACVDGEIDSVCGGPTGRNICQIVAWSC